VGALRIEIIGERLPGRVVGECTNVHVGIQRGDAVLSLVPGDAASARFSFDVVLRELEDGSLDFRGPYIHGTPGDRFLYLSWGDVDGDGAFARFGRAKLMLGAIPAGVLRPSTTRIEAYLGLSDDKGRPVCAAVRPPAISWSTG